MPHWYTATAAALNIALAITILAARLTPRTRCSLYTLGALNSGIYCLAAQAWPWDAINLGTALILTARWAMYPTKSEQEATQP
ncbi:hypothetical protein AB0958_19005 [Streptomyces sp. NPDC006655]|uniref:hypothetical protein n=1 Tax=Streptomyces sp. NPDC006655 TaxID=3156898 RepID=UPI003453BDF1